MKKKNVKAYAVIAMIAVLSVALTGCGKKKDLSGALSPKTPDIEQTEDDGYRAPVEIEDMTDGETLVDITSWDEVTHFLNGDWRLIDTVTGKEFATLSIDEDKCSFKRDDSDILTEGKFNILSHQTYDPKADSYTDDKVFTEFEMSFSDIDPALAFSGTPEEVYPTEEETGGKFYISSGDGLDYLYLKWIGNGDSYIFGSIFQNTERLMEEYGREGDFKPLSDWVFVKENYGLDEKDPEKDGEFYGFVWSKDKNGDLLVEEMDPNSYEALSEYVGRNYLETYFSEQKDIGLKRCKLASGADKSGVFNSEKLDGDYPLLMCSFKTDKDGRIKEINEVDNSYYGNYDLGTSDQRMSYNNLRFGINDWSADLNEVTDSVANAIMDMYEVGDKWIVIEAHVNPHVGEYHLYNNFTGQIEKSITGANLTWVGDDITTAVYSTFGQVYNFKDHLIFQTDGAEVSDITYNAKGTSIKVTDFDGNEYDVDVDNDDTAMYRLADFLRSNNASDWKAFVKEAPAGAIAYVMVNPPSDVATQLEPYLYDIGTQTEETVYIVPLENDSDVILGKGDFDIEKNKFASQTNVYTTTVQKGRPAGFNVMAAETIPEYCITLVSGDDAVAFPVSMITGQSDQCGEFLVADMDREKAYESIGSGSGEFDLLDSYMDILFQYKEAQDEELSMDEVLGRGIKTELVQFGWPYASAGDDTAGYVLKDINGDEVPELLITYYDSIVDIYTTDGEKVICDYNCPYRGIATIYEGGVVQELFSYSADSGYNIYLKLDEKTGNFYPLFRARFEGKKTRYGMYPYALRPEEVTKACEKGEEPEWVWSIEKEISEKEFENLAADFKEAVIPKPTPLSEFKGL